MRPVLSYFEAYEQLHEALVSSNSSRLLVLRLTDAGIGNRLTASVSALVLGMLSRRAVVIDGSSYRFARIVSPRRIRWDFDAFPSTRFVSLSNAVSVTPASLLCHDFSSGVWSDAQRIVTMTTSDNFLPFLEENPRYAALFRGNGPMAVKGLFGFLLSRYFALADSLEARLNRLQRKVNSFHPVKTIGVHLRGMYHTQEHVLTQLECARFLAAEARKGLSGARVRVAFYVAADSPDWRRYAAAFLQHDKGGRNLVFVQNDPALEESKDLDPDPQYRGNTAGLEGAAVDLWMLGRCDDLVSSAGSTFSYVAQALQGRASVTITRQGKCVRSLTAEPISSTLPDLQSQPCWKPSMWRVEKDQLCSDPLNPVSCGGKFERLIEGETTDWLREINRLQWSELPQPVKEAVQKRQDANAREKARALLERPEFWKQ